MEREHVHREAARVSQDMLDRGVFLSIAEARNILTDLIIKAELASFHQPGNGDGGKGLGGRKPQHDGVSTHGKARARLPDGDVQHRHTFPGHKKLGTVMQVRLLLLLQ